MSLSKRTRQARVGFTLIELLVVIAIIAVLVSLTSVAVMKIMGKGPETQTRVEIGQLETGIASARTELGLDYVPSYLVLREDNAYDLNNAEHRATISLLQKMFGRHVDLRPVTAGGPGIDWNGNGRIDSGVDLILEGQHCLVFLLGGIPTPPGASAGCLGFSTDPVNPATPGGTRRGPYYEFKTNHLVRDPNNGFFTYRDAFDGQPYAYFSSRKSGNDYFTQYRPGSYRLRADRAPGAGPGDCPSLYDVGLTLGAFNDGTQFLKPRGFQIVSAGPNGAFGPGGTWNPSTGYPPGGATQAGEDDLANFSAGKLGTPQR
jgi:prepilin-type N-terminal cleavage/methylation domain-containing protein